MKPGGGDGPHIFVDNLERPVPSGEDLHHLIRSLRLRPGDTFTASDGAGAWRLCRMGSGAVGAGGVGAGGEPVVEPAVETAGDIVRVDAPRPGVTVGFALIKGGRPELVVQKLTELGVDAIVPFVADHSVVRWDGDRADRHVERLRRVAREAAMQSRQVRLPEISPVAEFAELAVRPGAVRADMGGDPPSLEHPVVLVGPEGGWSEAERAQLGAMALGSSVLRAETAAIAAATLLTALRAGVVTAG